MAEFNVSNPSFELHPLVEAPPKPETELPLPPPAPEMLALPPLAIYPSKVALFEAIQSWAKACGYAFTISKSRRQNQRQKVVYACDRCPPTPLPNTIRIRETQTRGTGCLFSILAVELPSSLGWEVRYRPEAKYNTHNHLASLSPGAHPLYRRLPIAVKANIQELFLAGRLLAIFLRLNCQGL
jgi:hypothetical protein